MKFLVISKLRIHPYEFEDPIGLMTAAQNYFEDAFAKGSIELGYGFLDHGGFMILEASSSEDLWDIIHQNPINWAYEYEIKPLVEMTHAFKRFFEAVEKSKE